MTFISFLSEEGPGTGQPLPLLITIIDKVAAIKIHRLQVTVYCGGKTLPLLTSSTNSLLYQDS